MRLRLVVFVHRHGADTNDPSESAREIHASFLALLHGGYETDAREVPGARSTIGYFAHRDVAVVPTTGLDRKTAHRIVRSIGWEAMPIRGRLTGEDVEAGRPAPDLIHAAEWLTSSQPVVAR